LVPLSCALHREEQSMVHKLFELKLKEKSLALLEACARWI
jgi:hypothetical protein